MFTSRSGEERWPGVLASGSVVAFGGMEESIMPEMLIGNKRRLGNRRLRISVMPTAVRSFTPPMADR